MPEQWKLIDAKGLILGRMCSHVVKLSEVGQHIVIINGKDAIVSGAKNNINEHYQHYKNIKTRTNPKHGPFRVGSRPDIFVNPEFMCISLIFLKRKRHNMEHQKK
jgi:ribosomal protein L13